MINQTALHRQPQTQDQPVSLGLFVGQPSDIDSSGSETVGREPNPSDERRITFQSKAMNGLVQLATRFAKSSASVMIVGESGTGKELFSQLIHQKSHRRNQPLVAVNCAAIPEGLLESEMFGHERGAFTGASQRRVGHFELADQGTILLDEISEIPLAMQAKLLRVIEEQEVLSVGSDQPRRIDVRVIATSNRDLQAEVDAGNFRSDLYHRLNVLEINLPPLRDRKSDIPLLVMHFVRMFRHESMNGVQGVTREAMHQLCHYHWPGNVRQLRNAVHRACVVSTSGEIDVHALPQWRSSPKKLEATGDLTGVPLAEVERLLILQSLKKFGGNKTLAANELGVTARTLSNKLKLYAEATSEVVKDH